MRFAVMSMCLAGAAQAGGFNPPKGCEVYLTVQSKSCTVEHHWTCQDDLPGDKWHAEISARGLVFIGKVDGEGQWLDSYYPGNDGHEWLLTPATDPASLTDLFETGLDTYDFRIQTGEGERFVRGYDRIAERDVMIDGERLHRTEYDMRITDGEGAVTYASKGAEFVSERHGRFFSGYGDVTGPQTPYAYDDRPVEFIYAGESGFRDERPKYGCDVQSARAVGE